MLDPTELAQLASTAGIGDQPFAASIRLNDRPLVSFVQGVWQDGSPVLASDRFYGASLTKQLTGAAIALLVRDGQLDLDAPLGHYLPKLPAWRDTVSVRHLLHHTSGMPEAGSLEGAEEGANWTNAWAMAQLQGLASLPVPAGAEFRYSNVGYIALAEIVSRVSGDTFPRFVSARTLAPLGLSALTIWDEGTKLPFPQVEYMGNQLPLSVGDGGLWSTADGFALWLDNQNRDALGTASLVEQAGVLSDGTRTDYGWGIGLRTYKGAPMFVHGGGWQGASARAIRIPRLRLSLAVFTTGNSPNALDGFVTAALERVTGASQD